MGRVTVKPATRSRVPPLRLGDNRTTSSALHRLQYNGPLKPWENFLQDVQDTDAAQSWRRTSIRLQHIDSVHEYFEVGDESGVQSRFIQNCGEELGRIFEAQGIDLNFSDFRCLGLSYTKTPDIVLKTKQGRAKSRWRNQGTLGQYSQAMPCICI